MYIIQNPRKYVRAWLAKEKIDIDERGNFQNTNDKNDEEVFCTMYLDYLQQHAEFCLTADKKIGAIKEEVLKKALTEYISLEVLRRRKEIIESLKFSGSDSNTEMLKFVRAMTGSEDPKIVAVLSHWLWQVKRKLNKLEVVYHIMPIIFGKQGAGKGEALKRFCKPLEALTLDSKLKDVLDTEKFGFALDRNFIVRFDEMSGATKADVEEFKRQITASNNDTRKYFSQNVVKLKQNVSFIGTTNRAVNEILYDVTGMRRFYQIDSLDKMDWAGINSVDYETMYRNINEGRDRGYMEDLATEIAAEQEKLVGQDDLAAFMEFYHILPNSTDTKDVTSSDLYNKFVQWCEDNGIARPPNSSWFGKRISNRGISSAKKRVQGKTQNVYSINTDSSIHGSGLYISLEKPIPAAKVDA